MTTRVLCLGEILYDLIADQAGVPLEQVQSWTPFPGGAPANVACALARLGITSGFVGCVGTDERGTALVELLTARQVDITGVQRHSTAPTRGVYVVRTATGDRQFAGFGDADTTAFADAQLQADHLPVALFEQAEYLVTGTLELAYPDSGAAVRRAFDLADDYNLKVMLDVNWRPVFWPDPDIAPGLIKDLLPRIDFFKLSDDEADWLFDTTDPGVIAHRVGDLEGVLVTAGEKGAAYYLAGNEGHVPAFAVEATDTTGSGDCFLAGVLYQLCQHGLRQLEEPAIAREIVVYGSAMGALTATKPGAIAAQPTAAEVADFLAQAGH